ncbi:hypothetical protein RJG79_08150 [Mycoplasmatota bacterium WC44]
MKSREEEQWIIKINDNIPYVIIPNEFRIDSDIESMPLGDFISLINQNSNLDVEEGETSSRGLLNVKHCCLLDKIKHCCVKDIMKHCCTRDIMKHCCIK